MISIQQDGLSFHQEKQVFALTCLTLVIHKQSLMFAKLYQIRHHVKQTVSASLLQLTVFCMKIAIAKKVKNTELMTFTMGKLWKHVTSIA